MSLKSFLPLMNNQKFKNLKKIIFTLLLTGIVSVSYGQVLQARVLNVDPQNMEKLGNAIAQKTKLYNDKEGSARFFTFQILTGPHTNDFYRVQWTETISDFDKSVNKEELDYWWKVTGKLHESGPNRIFAVNEEATYQPEDATPVNHRRVLFYKLKPGHENDFWNYRTRLKKALIAVNWPGRVGVMNCQSGCNGNWVSVRYHHRNYEMEAEENSAMFPKVLEKYNEMFGQDAYEDDSKRLRLSVTESITQHQKLRPEMSSSW